MHLYAVVAWCVLSPLVIPLGVVLHDLGRAVKIFAELWIYVHVSEKLIEEIVSHYVEYDYDHKMQKGRM